MADVVDTATRSRMMSGIRGKNTKPEILVRKALHAEGLRFRIHRKDLPGKPDLVLPKYKIVVFVHGCFWHGHDCRLFKLPTTRREFWQEKIESNTKRDSRAYERLREAGWRIGVVWECAIKGKHEDLIRQVMHPLAEWVRSSNNTDFVLDERQGKAPIIF